MGADKPQVFPFYDPLLWVMDEVCASVAEHQLN